MRHKYALLLVGIFLIADLVHAQQADTVFARYFRLAQAFADAYPREKAYLHLDNSSYYLGDTIWYKAYVTLAERNQASPVSKPLYVELLDQLGNVVERQVVQLKEGEGQGQMILNNTFFTGYYEIRAYTKWMLAFDEKQYFSRTLPVYRKRLNDKEEPRSIATYRMDESMKQRPADKKGKFTVRFFPEGGQLVKGISTVVAFQAESSDKGPADVEGKVLSEKGEMLAQMSTLHDGMGYFLYQPEEKSATAEVVYEGRIYRFKLPESLPGGYALRVDNKKDRLEVTITRSSQEFSDTLALFASSQGRPYIYAVVTFDGSLTRRFQIPVDDLPGGVTQLSLMSSEGNVLCERFCYLMPKVSLNVAVEMNRWLYRPYERVSCSIRVKDQQNSPVQTRFSVAIRDGINSDYQEYDHTIYTDLLLTSDLKGYIHQPGFYFAEQSAGRRKMLDILLLVHGWRKYDMEQIMTERTFRPRFSPERTLTLYGQVKSLLGKTQPYIGVSVLARKDSVSVAGMTKADSLGYFNIPMDGFTGSMEAYIQTRNQGKNMNKLATVSLFRNFEPPLRKYNYWELHPEWKGSEVLEQMQVVSDSLYKDSILGTDNHLLDEVIVDAKRTGQSLEKTKRFERDILGYYDLTQIVNRMRDEGKDVYNLPVLLQALNPNFHSSIEDSQSLTYKGMKVIFTLNGRFLSVGNTGNILDKDVDAIQSILLYYDQASGESMYVMNRRSNRVVKMNLKDFWKDYADEREAGELFDVDAGMEDMETFASRQTSERDSTGMTKGPVVICSITTLDKWDPDKTYKTHRGIRYTYIQGYNQPLEFYSPAYPDGVPFYEEDHRRTLYWNPDVRTNEQGEATIQCYNSDNSAPLIISAETLHNGCPAASLYFRQVWK